MLQCIAYYYRVSVGYSDSKALVKVKPSISKIRRLLFLDLRLNCSEISNFNAVSDYIEIC